MNEIFNSPFLKDPESLDFIANEVISRLKKEGYLNSYNDEWLNYYDRLRDVMKNKFYIPQTSITPLMSRVLFGISFHLKPKVILGIGTYVGYTLALVSGYIQIKKVSGKYKVYGVDPDRKAIEIAKKNFSELKGNKYTYFFAMKGEQFISKCSDGIELLYLDADDPINRKGIYSKLLKLVYSKLSNKAVVIAHDVLYPKFRNNFKEYLGIVRDESLFKKSITLPLDKYGVEISIKK